CVFDVERGVVESIWPQPWQTDTCVGHWHYDKRAQYKTPKTVIDMLVDIVSRNGNLMLNFPLTKSGLLDSEEEKILEAITAWMDVNSEAIYATRPWVTYGVQLGPVLTAGGSARNTAAESKFNEKNRKDLTASDLRFTTKGQTLYLFVMGWPSGPLTIP